MDIKWALRRPWRAAPRGLALSSAPLYMAMAAHRALSRRDEPPMAEKKERPRKIVADNRKARFNYEIGEVVEAGIALTGTEVKSLRTGRATIAEAYADAKNGEIWLIN